MMPGSVLGKITNLNMLEYVPANVTRNSAELKNVPDYQLVDPRRTENVEQHVTDACLSQEENKTEHVCGADDTEEETCHNKGNAIVFEMENTQNFEESISHIEDNLETYEVQNSPNIKSTLHFEEEMIIDENTLIVESENITDEDSMEVEIENDAVADDNFAAPASIKENSSAEQLDICVTEEKPKNLDLERNTIFDMKNSKVFEGNSPKDNHSSTFYDSNMDTDTLIVNKSPVFVEESAINEEGIFSIGKCVTDVHEENIPSLEVPTANIEVDISVTDEIENNAILEDDNIMDGENHSLDNKYMIDIEIPENSITNNTLALKENSTAVGVENALAGDKAENRVIEKKSINLKEEHVSNHNEKIESNIPTIKMKHVLEADKRSSKKINDECISHQKEIDTNVEKNTSKVERENCMDDLETPCVNDKVITEKITHQEENILNIQENPNYAGNDLTSKEENSAVDIENSMSIVKGFSNKIKEDCNTINEQVNHSIAGDISEIERIVVNDNSSMTTQSNSTFDEEEYIINTGSNVLAKNTCTVDDQTKTDLNVDEIFAKVEHITIDKNNSITCMKENVPVIYNEQTATVIEDKNNACDESCISKSEESTFIIENPKPECIQSVKENSIASFQENAATIQENNTTNHIELVSTELIKQKHISEEEKPAASEKATLNIEEVSNTVEVVCQENIEEFEVSNSGVHNYIDTFEIENSFIGENNMLDIEIDNVATIEIDNNSNTEENLLTAENSLTFEEEISIGEENTNSSACISDAEQEDLHEQENKKKSISSSECKDKVFSFLNKHGITLKQLCEKIKPLKRLMKDKVKLHRVFSVKMKKRNLKQLKLKRTKRNKTIKHNEVQQKHTKNICTNRQEKLRNITFLEPTGDHALYCAKEEKEYEKDSEASSSSSLLVLSRLQANDDVREKIKKQLELLRQNKKIPSKDQLENKNDVAEEQQSSQPEASVSTSNDSGETNTSSSSVGKAVPANLSEVLISNESELSIVSVIGGYVSDDDAPSKNETGKDQNSSTTSLHESGSNLPTNDTEKTSITDILLKREFLPDDTSDSVEPQAITPTKTNDITKIKGWRRKQFVEKLRLIAKANKQEDVEQNPSENVDSVESTQLKCMTGDYTAKENSDDPIPSTSSFNPDSEQPISEADSENILKQGEALKIIENKKSAFISDKLDKFLSNAELKISYEVPKLVAEETISKPANELPLVLQENLANSSNPNQSKVSNKTTFKPKTVAEKRRMLEMDRKRKLMENIKTEENDYIKKLEHSKLEKQLAARRTIEDILVAQDDPLTRTSWKDATKSYVDFQQYVTFNNKRIRISGSAGGRNFIVQTGCRVRYPTPSNVPPAPDTSPRKFLLNRFSKPSLISVTTERENPTVLKPVEYKPGPLCKKRKLKNNDDNWECRVLKMPKIKLIVYPEQGKPFPSLAEKYLQLCRAEDGYISDNWAKFAVSAVPSNVNTKKEIAFELPYANRQNKLLVRKLVDRSSAISSYQEPIAKPLSNLSMEEEIKGMMSDMLDCVENHEIENAIIRDDPDLNYLSRINEKPECRPPSPIDPRVQAIIKRRNIKRNKTTLELRRLNVQVIEVDMEDEDSEMEECVKEYCRLGCVCKSLRGQGGFVQQHCGQEQCMLACRCSFGTMQPGHHAITLPAGTDLLSASTVVRLQDEVKRNLAKEEAKFAQTVIKANNQTIMVGDGVRERHRRVPKVPKKYSNYVQKNKNLSYMEMISDGLLEDVAGTDEVAHDLTDDSSASVELKKPEMCKKNNACEKVCYIKVERLMHLDKVLPWCMVHHLYKCHCGGKAIPVVHEEEQKPNVKTQEKDTGTSPLRIKLPVHRTRLSTSESSSVTLGFEDSEESSARTRPLTTNYYQVRNNSQAYRAHYSKMKLAEEKNELFFETGNATDDLNSIIDDSCRATDSPNVQDMKPSAPPVNESEIQDTPADHKPQTSSEAVADKTPILTSSSFVDYGRSFTGLLTPSQEWLGKFQKMLSLGVSNTIVHQIRLLEWATLIERQKRGSLQLWFNNRKQNNIILTEDRRRPSRVHMNIKLFEKTQLENLRVPEIITCLFQNKLPGAAKNPHDTFVILVYNGTHWEARGTIVLNNNSENYSARLKHKPTPTSVLYPDLTLDAFHNRKSKPKEPVKNTSLIEAPITNAKVKDPVSKEVPVKEPPPKQKLVKKPWPSKDVSLLIKSTPSMSVQVVPDNIYNSNKPKNTSTDVAKVVTNAPPVPAEESHINIVPSLPNISGSSRWFMVFLENDFSVLRVTFTNFQIKFMHLLTAVQMARNNQKTVRIRCQGKSNNPKYAVFGIHAVPTYSDRVFFGPYENDSEHGLETYRYVNGSLINTKLYNRMLGIPERKCLGLWYNHNALANNQLEEQQFEWFCPGGEYSLNTAEKTTKPQVEYVDLTDRDSDSETAPAESADDKSHLLLNVLAADFTNKVSEDITIKPVLKADPNVSKESSPCDNKEKVVVKQAGIIAHSASDVLKKKRFISRTSTIEPIKKIKLMDGSAQNVTKEPVVIDLDADDPPPEQPQQRKKPDTATITPLKQSNTNEPPDKRRMPELHPIVRTENKQIEVPKGDMASSTKLYITTSIPGLGYFEVILFKKKYCIPFSIKNKEITAFNSLNLLIRWLNMLLHKRMYVMPRTLRIRYLVNEKNVPADLPKFNENYLSGHHMLCEKGIFDIMRMSISEMDALGFHDKDSTTLLAYKCQLLRERNTKLMPQLVKVSGSTNCPEPLLKLKSVLKDAAKKFVKPEIIPNTICDTNSAVSSSERETRTEETATTSKFPFRKIITGKMLVVNQNTITYPLNLVPRANAKSILQKPEQKSSVEYLVPIAGLDKPAKVVGLSAETAASKTSLLLPKHQPTINSGFVDLTDD